MTHFTVSYANSPTKAFDAISDIKDWLGADRFTSLTVLLVPITDCDYFQFCCSVAGIEGYPVKAWYEHIHGQNSWEEPTYD